MIKILDPVEDQTIACRKCGCVFSFEQKDIIIEKARGAKQVVTKINGFVPCPNEHCAEQVYIRR